MPGAIDQEKASSLYDAISETHDVGTWEEFLENIQDRSKRINLYNAISSQYDVGSLEEYESTLNPEADDDYDPNDPAFDDFGHRRYKEGETDEDGYVNYEPMRSFNQNFETLNDYTKKTDSEYNRILKEEGVESAEAYYEERQKIDFIADPNKSNASINYWGGEMINDAQNKGYVGSETSIHNGLKSYMNDQNSVYAQVYFDADSDKMEEFNLSNDSRLIQEDIDLLNQFYEKRKGGYLIETTDEDYDPSQESAEDTKYLDQEHQSQLEVLQKKLAENQKKIAEIRYKRYKENGGNLPLYKEALDKGSVSSPELIKAIKTIDGDVPEEVLNAIASEETININPENMNDYEKQKLAVRNMEVKTRDVVSAAMNLEGYFDEDYRPLLELADENGVINFSDYNNNPQLAEIRELLTQSVKYTEDSAAENGMEVNDKSLRAYDYINDAFIKTSMENTAFLKPDAERREDAISKFEALGVLEEMNIPEGLNNREKFNFIWHAFAKQKQDYTDRYYSGDYAGLKIFGESIKQAFLGADAEDTRMYEITRVLDEYADLALLNFNSLDVKPDGVLEYVTDFVGNVGRVLGVDRAPMLAATVGTGYKDARMIGEMAQSIDLLDANIMPEGVKEQMSEVYDFENQEFKSAGLGDGEFWEDAIGNSLGIMIDIVAGGKGAKAALKSGKLGRNLIRVANAEKGAMKKLMKQPKFVNSVADKNFIMRAATKAGHSRRLAKMTETALTYQAGGLMFPKDINELNLATGMFGYFGEALLTKMLPKTELLSRAVNKMFGKNAKKAFDAIAKHGETLRRMGGRGIGEVGEENAQQIAQMWLNDSEQNPFWEQFANTYGDVDEVLKLGVSSFVLGAAFGIADPTASKAYSKNVAKYRAQLNKAKKQILDNFIATYNNNMQQAMETAISDAEAEKTGEREFTAQEISQARYADSSQRTKDYMSMMEGLSDEQIQEVSQQTGLDVNSLVSDEDMLSQAMDPNSDFITGEQRESLIKALDEQGAKVTKPAESVFRYKKDGAYSFEGVPEADAELVQSINDGTFTEETMNKMIEESLGDTEYSSVEDTDAARSSASIFALERVVSTAATIDVNLKNFNTIVESLNLPMVVEGSIKNAFAAANNFRITNAVINGATPPLTHSSSPTAAVDGKAEGLPIMHVGDGIDMLTDALDSRAENTTSRERSNFLKKFSNAIKKGLTSKGLAPEFVDALGNNRANRVKNAMNQYRGINKRFTEKAKKLYNGELNKDDIAKINEALRGDPEALKSIPKELHENISEMRNSVDALSQELIDIGAVRGDLKSQIQEGMGTYLNTSYAVHKNNNWVEAVDQQVIDDAVSFILGRDKASGGTLTQEDALGIVNSLLMNPRANSILMTSKSFGSVDTGVFKKKISTRAFLKAKADLEARIEKAIANGDSVLENELKAELNSLSKENFEIAPEIKALLGEYKDPSYNYLNTVQKLTALVENHKVLNELKDAGLEKGTFSETRGGKFSVEVPASNNYADNPLKGLYTTPEMAQVLTQYYEQAANNGKSAEKIFKVFQLINATAKVTKTVYSTGSTIANFVSAMAMNLYNGTPSVWKNKAGASVSEFMKLALSGGDFKASDLDPESNQTAFLYKIAIEDGVIDQSVQLKEMQAALRDLGRSKDPNAIIEKLTDQGLLAKGKRAFGKVKKAHQWAYAMGDDFPKFLQWTAEIQRYTMSNPVYKQILQKNNGDSEKALSEFMGTDEYKKVIKNSATIVKNCVPNYSRLPGIIQDLRKLPVLGTFVAFPAESIRTSINIPLQAIAEINSKDYKSIGYARMGGYIATHAMFIGLGNLTKNMIGVDDEEDDAWRELSAPWSRNTNWLYLGKDGDGAMQYIDLSRYDTFGYPREIINAFMRDGLTESFDVATKPFISASFSFSVAYGIAQGKDFSGKKIYEQEDEFGQKALNSLAYFEKMVLQNGYTKAAKEIYKAINQDDTEQYGRKYSVEEAIGGLIGGKAYTISPEMSARYRAYALKKQIEGSKMVYYADKTEDGLRRANEALKRNYEELSKLYKAMEMVDELTAEERFEIFYKALGNSKKGVYRVINEEPEVMISEEDKEEMKKIN